MLTPVITGMVAGLSVFGNAEMYADVTREFSASNCSVVTVLVIGTKRNSFL